MSSIEHQTQGPSPFDGLPDSRFFYGNLPTLEVLSALRFGIEARKGIILLTGAAGSGKTAVLHELARELNPKAACLLIADPGVRFSDVLDLILEHLGSAADAGDESALIVRCQAALRVQRETNRIFSLLFDDAQNLSDELIESLTSHFLGKGFDPDSNLLQIVLAGRPELRKRLLTPPLCTLATQVEVECRLRPLDVKDVGLYINHRLCAADLPPRMFEYEAVKRIAVYSGGRPDAVNAICSRALQLEQPAASGNITPAAIVRAAEDLKLAKDGLIDAETPPETLRNAAAPGEGSRFAASTVALQSPDPGVDEDNAREEEWLRGRMKGWTVALSVMLILAGASAAWLHGLPVLKPGIDWTAKLGSSEAMPEDEKIDSAEATLPGRDSRPAVLPKPDVPERSPAARESVSQPDSDSLQSVDPPSSGDVDHRASRENAESPEQPNPERGEFPPKAASESRTDPARQVAKAIQNRAILGVTVSVVDGIAYLDGRVATREQKNAAERAARAVADLRGVRNRIAVE